MIIALLFNITVITLQNYDESEREREHKGQRNGKLSQTGKLGQSCATMMKSGQPFPLTMGT